MIFAIDYDGTFSRDPPFWEDFVALARVHHHECVLVTGRTADGACGDAVKRAIGALMPIVFAGSDWKRIAAAKNGWKIDVWIDDNPEYVGEQWELLRTAHGAKR